ncbi:hypothetical protein HUN08_03100 [Gordonia sp. X0973]|uniref:hypothetical protein n=1 Tax=Gordonia sp. X0973 TaxID=2742602 RepID=UPI0013ED814A|nr:hypothetical protein [Gordonia sp. X0973]QKT06298.1 hypothetical protein HUN08_03100 [Gordonia sp. X0973]
MINPPPSDSPGEASPAPEQPVEPENTPIRRWRGGGGTGLRPKPNPKPQKAPGPQPKPKPNTKPKPKPARPSPWPWNWESPWLPWARPKVPDAMQWLVERYREYRAFRGRNPFYGDTWSAQELKDHWDYIEDEWITELERRLHEIPDRKLREEIQKYIDELRQLFKDEYRIRKQNEKNRRDRERESPQPPGDDPTPAPQEEPAPSTPGDDPTPIPQEEPAPPTPGGEPVPPIGDPPTQDVPDDPDGDQEQTPRYPPGVEQRPPEFEKRRNPEPKDENDDAAKHRRPKAPSLNPPKPPSVTPPEAPSVENPPPPQAPEAVPPPMRPGTPEADQFLRDIIAKAIDDFAKELEEFGDKLNPPAGDLPAEGFDDDTVRERARDLVNQAADYAWYLALQAAINPHFRAWLQAAIRGTHSHSLLEALLKTHVLPHVEAWLGPDIKLYLEESIDGGKVREDGKPISWAKRGESGSKRPDVILTRILEGGVEDVLAVLDLKTGDAKINKAWERAVAAALGIAEGEIGKLIKPVNPLPLGSRQ